MKNTFTIITLVLISLSAYAQTSIIFDDVDAIRRVDLDGTNYNTIIENPTNTNEPFDVEVDTFINQIFWSDDEKFELKKSDLDGSNPVVIYTGFVSLRGIALDESNQRIYWIENNNIKSSDYDGSNISTLVIEGYLPSSRALKHLEIDYENNKIYWTQDYYVYNAVSGTGSRTMRVKSVNLDGTGITTLYSSPTNYTLVMDLALDLKNDKIYYVDYRISTTTSVWGGTNTNYYVYIKSMDLDGNNYSLFKNYSSFYQHSVQIDDKRDELVLIRSGEVIRYALGDGSLISTVTNPNLSFGGRFHFNVQDDNYYLIDNSNLERLSYDNTEWDLLDLTDAVSPKLISYDELNNWVYWIDDFNYIARIRPNGSNKEILSDLNLGSMNQISSFTIDGMNNKIYWLSNQDGVMSMNLDGTNKVNLNPVIAANYFLLDLFLDNTNGKLYFRNRLGSTPFTSSIYSIKTDGTLLTQIIPDLGTTANEAFTVHPPTSKLYWVDTVNDIIKSSDTDGNNIVDIYNVNASNINEMVASDNKLHWYINNTLYYSDLDGTNVMAIPGVTAANNGARTIAISQNTVLPVELGYFRGKQVDDINKLEWNTLSETNNKGFEIERSTDGVSWDFIGFVDGRGNSTEEINYSFIDERPLFGDNYYRLKQIDFDGTFDTSDVILISFETKIRISLSPVPTKDLLTVTFPDLNDNVNATIRIVDVLGRILLEEELEVEKNGDNYTYDVSGYAPGTYYAIAFIGKSQYQNVQTFIIAKD